MSDQCHDIFCNWAHHSRDEEVDNERALRNHVCDVATARNPLLLEMELELN